MPLELIGTIAAATTYSFRTTGTGWRSWALCTVNETGELLITSDWGNWSYRWNTGSLGRPTLTAFIGDRDAVDYIACKLQGRNGGRRFSAEKTAAAMRRTLCERRLEVGRDGRKTTLTRALAREIWEDLGEVVDDVGGSDDLFIERVYRIDGFTDHVSETPYEDLEYEPTPEDRALRELILPALIAACAETHRQRPAPAPAAIG